MFEHNKDRMFLYTSPERKKKRSEKQTKVDAVKGVSVVETQNVAETSGGCRSPSKTFNDEDSPGTSGGVAPNGVVTYVSDLYPGSTSDKKIVEDSGILEKMEPGDLRADKGFLIKDLLPQGVSLNVPSFLITAQYTHLSKQFKQER
ncbi:hypothetical protein JTB14_015622 [Gonioctena quinquepunctata]|nr:hypothetical protein JTB14_015622 [Gonioctena quinquepunctata]